MERVSGSGCKKKQSEKIQFYLNSKTIIMEAEKLKEILSLSKEEKLELVQTLWDNISEEYQPDISREQLKIIKERLERIDKGETKLKDWDEIKKKYGKFE